MMRQLPTAALLCLACTAAWADDTSQDTVTAYFDAYNAHDIERMMTMVADDVKWRDAVALEYLRMIDGRCEVLYDYVVNTGNRQELAAALEGYFDAFPSARSIVRSISSNGGSVIVFEEAVWDAEGVPTSQCATAVYEVHEDVIVSVTYYGEQTCDD